MQRTLALVVLLMLSLSAFAQTLAPVPSLMNFQGRLAKPDGTPVPNGTYSIRFSLWNVASGGTAASNEKWNQTISTVNVNNGVFAVSLNTSTGAADKFKETLWLEVKIGTNAALTPRTLLASVPYAMKADIALTVPDGSITGAKIANGTITADKLANGAATPTGSAGGDLTGTYPNPLIAANPLLLPRTSNYGLNMIPARIGNTTGIPVFAQCVAVSGNYAAVTGSGFVNIIDISNPAAPEYKGMFTVQGSTHSLAMSGNFVYVANLSESKLHIFDISNPVSPVPRGQVDTNSFPEEITVSGNRVYMVSSDTDVLQIFDVSNPDSPTPRGSIASQDATDVAVVGNFAYVTSTADPSFLRVYNVSNPDAPTPRGSAQTNSFYSRKLAVRGNYAYVIDTFYNVLEVFNVSNPDMIEKVGSVEVPEARDVAVTEHYTYLATTQDFTTPGADVLSIVDTHDPTHPVFLRSFGNEQHYAQRQPLVISGNRAYVVGENLGLEIYDLYNGLYVRNELYVDKDVRMRGDLYVGGNARAQSFIQTSDARFKTDVQPISDPLDAILGLRGVTFDWNRSEFPDRKFGIGRQIGFIAQEVEKIFPELVFTDASGYKSVAYANIVPVLVEAVKQQQAQIKHQQKQIDTLANQNAEIAELKAQVAVLMELLKGEKILQK